MPEKNQISFKSHLMTMVLVINSADSLEKDDMDEIEFLSPDLMMKWCG